jgi:hypothetical protein
LTPNTKFIDAESGIKLDQFGFIETNAMLETSVPYGELQALFQARAAGPSDRT